MRACSAVTIASISPRVRPLRAAGFAMTSGRRTGPGPRREEPRGGTAALMPMVCSLLASRRQRYQTQTAGQVAVAIGDAAVLSVPLR